MTTALALRDRGQAIGLGAVLPLAIIVVWQVAGMAFGGVRMPLPSRIVAAALTMIASGDLPLAIVQSLGRVFGGFVIAALIAIPLGLAMGTARAVERNVDPVVETFRPIAAIAILPLAILWFGTGTSAAVMIVAYAAFFPIVVNTVAGAKDVNPTLRQAAATMGLSRLATMRTVVVPAALPSLLVALRLGVALSWTAVVAAELIGAPSGLGYAVEWYRELLATPQVMSFIAMIGVIGYLCDAFVRELNRRFTPWMPATR
jgi:ABC-type nitrate/sulfonate/bicarbonate transport system permease component